MTITAYNKAKTDLYNITANHALNDYLRMNTKNGKPISKKHIPYSLGYETQEAQEYYKILFNNTAEEITAEQEEQIKGFLLPYRIHRTEFLQDENMRRKRRFLIS